MHLSECPQQLEIVVVGHVKGMHVPAKFYASPKLLKLVSNEFHTATGGFTGDVQQLANVATLPGPTSSFSPRLSLALPDLHTISAFLMKSHRNRGKLNWNADIHSGYGSAVGNVAAFDLADPKQSYLLEGWGLTSTVVSDYCAQVCFSKFSTKSHIVGPGIFDTPTSTYCKLYSQPC